MTKQPEPKGKLDTENAATTAPCCWGRGKRAAVTAAQPPESWAAGSTAAAATTGDGQRQPRTPQ